jgi:hypothetical protein
MVIDWFELDSVMVPPGLFWVDCGGGFHLEEKVGMGKLMNRHGGAGWRFNVAEERTPLLVVGTEVIHVHQERGDIDQV